MSGRTTGWLLTMAVVMAGCGDTTPAENTDASDTDHTDVGNNDYEAETITTEGGTILERRSDKSEGCEPSESGIFEDQTKAGEAYDQKNRHAVDPTDCHYRRSCNLDASDRHWCNITCANYTPEDEDGGHWRLARLPDDRHAVYFECGDLSDCLDWHDGTCSSN